MEKAYGWDEGKAAGDQGTEEQDKRMLHRKEHRRNVSFGEDTDCICASLCSTLGILLGEDLIPAKWKDPLNDKISTCCIKNTSIGLWIPDTATELTERILRDIPLILDQDLCNIFGENGMTFPSCQTGR